MTERRGGGRRITDIWRDRLLVVAMAVLLVTLLVQGGLSVGVIGNRATIKDTQEAAEAAGRAAQAAKSAAYHSRHAVRRVKREAAERLDEDCKQAERTYASHVRQVKRTYDFLTTPSPLRDAFYDIAIRQLPQTEQDMRNSKPSKDCKPRNVGLAEPFPKPPRRPEGLPVP